MNLPQLLDIPEITNQDIAILSREILRSRENGDMTAMPLFRAYAEALHKKTGIPIHVCKEIVTQYTHDRAMKFVTTYFFDGVGAI